MIKLPSKWEHFQTKGFDQLSNKAQSLLSLLWHFYDKKQFSPFQWNNWDHLLESGQVFEKLWPNRTWASRLRQQEYMLASVGLYSDKMRRIDSKSAVAKDQSFFARCCALEWKEAIDLQLLKIKTLPEEEGLTIFQDAFDHAFSLYNCKSTFWLLKFAQEQNWGEKLKLKPETWAQLWIKWERIPKNEWIGNEHQQAQKLSIKISRSQERSLKFHEKVWVALLNESNTHGHVALWDWCQYFPEIVDPIHKKALKEKAIPNAWMAFCIIAHEKNALPTLDQYLSLPSSSAWLKQLSWGDAEASPLSTWAAYAISKKIIPQTLPLQGDNLSKLLLKHGALPIGSPQEQALGGNCFYRALNVYHQSYFLDEQNWRTQHPEWAYPDPSTGNNPLFDTRNWSEAKKKEQGFSWHQVNHEGQTALVVFLAHLGSKFKGKKTSHIDDWKTRFKNGIFPLLEQPDERSLGFLVANQANEDLFNDWLELRLNLPQKASLKETMEFSEYALSDSQWLKKWKKELVKVNQWNDEHELKAWEGLSLHGFSYYKNNFKDVIKILSWDPSLRENILFLKMKKVDYGSNDEFLNTLKFLFHYGAKPLSASHEAWQHPQWIGACLNTKTPLAEIGIPTDVDETWWRQQWDLWLKHHHKDRDALSSWIRLGLDKSLIVAWVEQAMGEHQINQEKVNQWMKNPEISSLWNQQKLDQATVSVQNNRPRVRI